ncbi:hypothetical protein OUZ56_024999 [Daphnia magna]|uniref:Uncharacterized protein n=1 Tax=Daphnia magna TaxID=35525 RepID=A0ABQ9ZIL5_9CRUS|nr:hypothetical protein OUZ56_024999 [Daphnia magna]
MASITWCILSLLGALTTTSAMLTFHQGGYNQLQVALNPQTPAPANCSQMFHHLESGMSGPKAAQLLQISICPSSCLTWTDALPSRKSLELN